MSPCPAAGIAETQGFEEAVSKPLVFVGGKGGVGKTTVAAALALALARRHPERRLLLLSTDPAHSLRDAFAGDVPPTNLEVEELDAVPTFGAFRRRHREGLRQAVLCGTFLKEEDVDRILDLGLPGLDELAALERIVAIRRDRTVEHLLVDTAPTGHTLALLSLPEVLASWREAIEALMAKHRLLARRFGARAARNEKDELIQALDETIEGFRALLVDPETTAFLPVLNADPLSWWETRRLIDALREGNVTIPWIILNRVAGPSATCARCEQRFRKEFEWRERIRREFPRGLVEAPRLRAEPRGTAALEGLGRFLLSGTPIEIAPPSPDFDGQADAPPARAPRRVRARLERAPFILVCGKGGAGKTTVACALALWGARRWGGRTLLFSTDPAHSVSDALALPVGPEPTCIAPGLDAVQVDPREGFRRLRELYRREIEAAVDALFPAAGLDPALDREALERLIDLAPPGLDEVMALAELARHARELTYDRFVIDTAPTGHFLRFLELPDLALGWTRGLFELFLKYPSLRRSPDVRRFLVELSRSIRQVQEAWRREEGAEILPVALPTALSLEETTDLVRRVGSLGLTVRAYLLNRWAAPGGDCGDCSALSAESRRFRDLYREAFPGLEFVALEEQPESPTGVEALTRIGGALLGEAGDP